jgi:hypothetical protein
MKKKIVFIGLVAVVLTLVFSAYVSATPEQYVPAMAYDPINNRYLLVYANGNLISEYNIYGQFINSDGTPFGLEFVISDADQEQSFPSVAYDGVNHRFLVVWHDYRNQYTIPDAYTDIYGQLVNANGSLYGGNFAISDATYSQSYPSVAYDGINQRFLVVWDETRNTWAPGTTGYDIYGQLVNANGTLYGTTSDVNFVITNAADTQYTTSVAYDSVYHRFLVVWEEYRNSGTTSSDIYGQLVNGDGTLFGTASDVNFAICNVSQPQSNPSVAYDNLNHRFLVAWGDSRPVIDMDIYGQLVNASGSLYGNNFAISNAATFQTFPSVAYDSVNQKFLVAWEDARNYGITGSDIYGQVVNANGSLYNTASNVNFVISDVTDHERSPVVVFNSNCANFLMAYKTETVPGMGLVLVGDPCPPPSKPSSLYARAKSSSSILLTWKDNSTNETGFKIERKSGACDSANIWSQIATKGANVKTHTNTGLNPNTTYSYRVRTYNGDGNSSYSNCASAKTAPAGTPKAPTNLNATSLSASQIRLTWADNSANETSFKIYRKVGAGSWGLLTTKGSNIVSHTNSTASGNTSTTTYSYYVQACNGNGCSPKTNTAIVPYKPTNLSANAVSSSKIKLAWADKSSNETGFEIWRKSGACSSTNDWFRITSTGANSISYGNIGLSSGVTYSYRVRAYKKSSAQPYAYSYSSYTNCSSTTTP